MDGVLMRVLEAGAKRGGDRRCGERTASSEFLTVGRATDSPQKPYLNLIVNGTNNTINAVEALRRKLNDWKNGK